MLSVKVGGAHLHAEAGSLATAVPSSSPERPALQDDFFQQVVTLPCSGCGKTAFIRHCGCHSLPCVFRHATRDDQLPRVLQSRARGSTHYEWVHALHTRYIPCQRPMPRNEDRRQMHHHGTRRHGKPSRAQVACERSLHHHVHERKTRLIAHLAGKLV